MFENGNFNIWKKITCEIEFQIIESYKFESKIRKILIYSTVL